MNGKVLLFFFLVIIAACQKEQSISEGKPIKGSQLKIEKFTNWLPKEYLNQNQKVIFKNWNNDKLELYISYLYIENAVLEAKKDYSTEFYSYKLESKDKEFNISVYLDVRHANEYYSPREQMNIVYGVTTVGLKPSLFLYLDSEQKKVFGPKSAEPTTEKELNQKKFTNVFSNESVLNKFSALHYNSTYGIIGFKDQNNELWVFDRFE